MERTMATIIAGRFEQQEQADALIRELRQAGVPADRFTCFFVNPPGHHDRFPLGGDRDESPGATEADSGALKGAGIGGAIGLGVGVAAAPLGGPAAVAAGAGVGAYVGSLVGALREVGEHGEPARLRQSGLLVAVHTIHGDEEQWVIDLLLTAGARDIERAQGQWRAGEWTDFDPIRPPALVERDGSNISSAA